MAKRAVRVEMARRVRPGGHTRTWGYGYPELASLLGMTEGAVRQAVARGTFNPGDLVSVLDFALRRPVRSRASPR